MVFKDGEFVPAVRQQTGWQPVPNPFNASVEFMVTASGFCVLRGLLVKPGAWAVGDVLATLPEGPSTRYISPVVRAAKDGHPSYYTSLVVQPNGEIQLGTGFSDGSASGTAINWISVDGICFQAAKFERGGGSS